MSLELLSKILSHNGEITLKNPKTNNHRTLRVKTVKKGNLKGKRIISLLIGPDNTSDYLGIGFVNDNGVSVWNKYKGTQYEKVLNCIHKIDQFGLEVHFDTVCRVCNRKLTHFDSILSGIGPECLKKV
jgi:hypothetical protein